MLIETCDQPATGQRFVQAFRRADRLQESAGIRFHGLEADAIYAVTDIDGKAKFAAQPGRELMSNGLLVNLPARPEAMVLVYKRTP